MATERLRLAPLVFNNDLRHPAVLAHELASLDILSGGRVDMASGRAGTSRIPGDRPSLRSTGDPDRSDDRGHRHPSRPVRGGPLSYAGRYYTITDVDGQPKPVQRPHPPFIIGGTRESGSSGWRLERPTSSGSTCVRTGAAILDAFPERMDVRVAWIRDEAGDRLERLD